MARLRQERDKQGWTKARLVAVIEAQARSMGITLGTTRQSLTRQVSFWESGQRNPQEPMLSILCAVYDRSAYELGLSPTPDQARSDVGLVYSPSLVDAVATLTKLASFDATRHTSVTHDAYSIDALNAACMDWLFHDSRNGTRDGRITETDVVEVQAATQVFDNLDRTAGGEPQRMLAVQFLQDRLAPRLSEASDDEQSKALFTAASTLCEVIGWMAYDAERHSAAQRYFVQALRLAKDADEPAYGAYVLTTMAHQALYLKQPDQALRCALAAKSNPHVKAAPIVATEATLLAARAYASMGSEQDCRAMLLEAEQEFSRATSANTPSWAKHWTPAVFSTFVGTCWVELSRPHEAYEPLKLAWDAARDQPRRRVYSTGQLAKVAALNNDVERAASLGLMAVESSSKQSSRRSLQVIREVDGKLKRYSKQPHVREFRERARVLLAG